MPQGVQSTVQGPAEVGGEPVHDVGGLDQGAVGAARRTPRRALVGLGEQPDQ